MTDPAQRRQLVDAPTLAHILRVSPEQIVRMFREGDLPAYRAGKVALRFDVDECLRRLRIDQREPEPQGGVA